MSEHRPTRAEIDAAPWNFCLDCEARLIPCTCSPYCPGGMCPDQKCNPSAPSRETETP